jgi:rhamnosyltransferase
MLLTKLKLYLDFIKFVYLGCGCDILYRVAAGIILYNPDLIRLKENIDNIYNQVEIVVLIDNNSSNINLIEKEYSLYKNIIIIKNESNLGIATALNQAMSYCQTKGYMWVLTLDQDSVCPTNLMEEYRKYLDLPNVAMVSPVIADRNRKEKLRGRVPNTHYEVVDKCITSAALTSVAVWEEIGGFDSQMFIDLVDFEYCKRVILNGYEIIKINTVVLLHEIGHITQHKFLIWEINVKNHSPFRKYYMARNILYDAQKHKTKDSIMKAYLRVLKLFIITILFEKDKAKKGIAIIKGFKIGKKLRAPDIV